LCYCNTLNSHTKCRLFQSYCTRFYGCELWCLLDNEVQGLCIAWRNSIRKIWELLYRTHCYLLPLLCHSVPIFDQICIRTLNFVQRCLSHDSDVVKFISDYCIKYGHSNSYIGKNVMFHMRRYKCNFEMVFSGQMNNIIESHFIRYTYCMHAALPSLLFEIIVVWDAIAYMVFARS